MGSIVMHLAISEKIRKKYGFGELFLVGSVMPDIKKQIIGKEATHYLRYYEERGNSYRLPDLSLRTEVEENVGYFIQTISHPSKFWFVFIN